MLIGKDCSYRWSRVLVLPDHNLILAFLKQYKEINHISLEIATIFKAIGRRILIQRSLTNLWGLC